MIGHRTPEKVKAALATLPKRPKITNATIEDWCHRAGRWPATAEKLAEVLKKMQGLEKETLT